MLKKQETSLQNLGLAHVHSHNLVARARKLQDKSVGEWSASMQKLKTEQLAS